MVAYSYGLGLQVARNGYAVNRPNRYEIPIQIAIHVLMGGTIHRECLLPRDVMGKQYVVFPDEDTERLHRFHQRMVFDLLCRDHQQTVPHTMLHSLRVVPLHGIRSKHRGLPSRIQHCTNAVSPHHGNHHQRERII